jgi:metal transporter CNNM
MTILVWIGIAACISQSAMLSGSNLAFFTVSKLRLELEVSKNNHYAERVLQLREDANFLLVTILWGNVSVNVLLALLSGSVLSGIMAFFFSTVIITLIGEIVPQAYFSRNSLRVGHFLAPVIRVYQLILYPVAKPTAVLLDMWLGPEAIRYYDEKDLRDIITMHAQAAETEIDRVEGIGALNFLAIDDLPVSLEGERIDPDSVITLSFIRGMPVFPDISASGEDEFLRRIDLPRKKWIIITDLNGEPRMTINSDRFIREAIFRSETFNPHYYCHRPIIVRNGQERLGEIIPHLKVHPERSDDDVIDEDIILLWENEERRIITGSDILGRLLRGIVRNEAYYGGKPDLSDTMPVDIP